MYRTLMVAVDGSKNADLALAEALPVGKACGSEIAVVHVIENTYLRAGHHCPTPHVSCQ
jgi:nucleotide-binding universal stress UspA family protein